MKYRMKLLPLIMILGCLVVCYQMRGRLLDLYRELSAESGEKEEIDFAYWQAKNPDVYAWIRIPGTEIDYPVLQHASDDSYYLTHDIDGDLNIYGAIFSERVNGKEFTDANTVLYGHNMVDNSMFGSLKKYQEQAYFEEHQEIVIFLPNETRKYKIVAAYLYPAGHLMAGYDFSTPEGTKCYLEQIPEFVQRTDGNIREGQEITPPLLTLSTCTGNDSSMRQLVQAVLVGKEEKEQES